MEARFFEKSVPFRTYHPATEEETSAYAERTPALQDPEERTVVKFSKNIIAVAAIAAASFSGIAFASEGWSNPDPVVAGPSLSRAEVLADFAIWKRAGMSVYNQGDQSTVDTVYEQRKALYQKMRSGAEYEEELRLQRSAAK